MNPLADAAPLDADDAGLVSRARAGSRDALEQLISRHQRWIYNIVRRMTYGRPDAEDATQEILIKVITKLATFEEKSRVEEAKALCTSGMLLCLDREQRLVVILGEILGVSDRVGAELLETSRENFCQKLSRARRDLHNFMQNKCGLVNEANPCRCAKKTDGFIKAGYVQPGELRFVQARVVRVQEVTGEAVEALTALDSAYAEIYRNHPFHESPDFVGRVRALLADGRFTFPLELP
jgi:DNA-directed RNA polymerase specialized sigma24 family protein